MAFPLGSVSCTQRVRQPHSFLAPLWFRISSLDFFQNSLDETETGGLSICADSTSTAFGKLSVAISLKNRIESPSKSPSLLVPQKKTTLRTSTFGGGIPQTSLDKTELKQKSLSMRADSF